MRSSCKSHFCLFLFVFHRTSTECCNFWSGGLYGSTHFWYVKWCLADFSSSVWSSVLAWIFLLSSKFPKWNLMTCGIFTSCNRAKNSRSLAFVIVLLKHSGRHPRISKVYYSVITRCLQFQKDLTKIFMTVYPRHVLKCVLITFLGLEKTLLLMNILV